MSTTGYKLPQLGPSDRRNLVLASIFLASLIPLFCTPVLPTIDFYNHVARYYVMSHIGHNPALLQNYTVTWRLLPNLGLDVIGYGLTSVFPVLVAARIIAVMIFLTQYVGVIALNRVLIGRWSVFVGLLSAQLLCSYIFISGFSNFLLGLGLAFCGAAWWMWMRTRPKLGVPVAIGIAVLVYFAHAFAFAMYGILVVGLELGVWLNAPDRKLQGLVRALVPVAGQAVLPAALFLLSPTAGAHSVTNNVAVAHYAGHTDLLWRRILVEIERRIETVVRVAEGPSYLFDALVFAALACGLGYLIWKRKLRVRRICLAALAIFAVLCVITPPGLFGVGYVSDRVPLALAMLFVASLEPQLAKVTTRRWAVGLLAAVLIIRVVAVSADWTRYRSYYASFLSVAAAIPPTSLVTALVDKGSDPRDGLNPRCDMYSPLTIVARGAISPLFSDPGMQPLELSGPLARAEDAVKVDSSSNPNLRVVSVPGFYDDELARIARGRQFQYVIVCGGSRLTRPLPSNLQRVAASGPLELYKIN